MDMRYCVYTNKNLSASKYAVPQQLAESVLNQNKFVIFWQRRVSSEKSVLRASTSVVRPLANWINRLRRLSLPVIIGRDAEPTHCGLTLSQSAAISFRKSKFVACSADRRPGAALNDDG